MDYALIHPMTGTVIAGLIVSMLALWAIGLIRLHLR